MAVRVRDFLRGKPFGTPEGDGVAAQFEAAVGRALDLTDQVAGGDRSDRAASAVRRGIRRSVRGEVLKHMARVAEAAAAEKPQVAEQFRLPKIAGTEADFRSVARTFLVEAQANEALFKKHGMWAGASEELKGRLEAYDRVSADGNAGRATHTGARGELAMLSRKLIQMVKQLDGMMLIRFREDPSLRSAWESARNVAWPGPAVAPPAAGDPKAA